MYTAVEPTGLLAEYMAWIFTDAAQTIVTELGFVPITP
jgi:ABC-type phosphate transport system substrate-binding protein